MESREERLERIEAHQEAQTCSICLKHLDYTDGCYSLTHAHYDCQFPPGAPSVDEALTQATEKLDAALSSVGFKPKRRRAKDGTGASALKLIALITASAKAHFETENVTDVQLSIAPPVWRQAKFDVMRIEGSMVVDNRTIQLGSSYPIKTLNQYDKVLFEDDWPALNITPDESSKKLRKSQSHSA